MKLSSSAGLTAAETKQCADKLLKTSTKATATPATGLLNIVDLGGAVKKVYVHPSVPEHDIHPDSVVAGGMPLRVLLLDF